MKINFDVTTMIGEGFLLMDVKEDGCSFRHRRAEDFTVIVSESVKDDGNTWIHISLAREKRVPEYKEIKLVKELILGDLYAYMVFPPKDRFVNIHKYCLHLFACVEKNHYLPEMSGEIDSKRTL